MHGQNHIKSDYLCLFGTGIKNEWSYTYTYIMGNVGVILTLCTKPEVSTVGIVEDTDIASHPRRSESSKIYFAFIKRLDRT